MQLTSCLTHPSSYAQKPSRSVSARRHILIPSTHDHSNVESSRLATNSDMFSGGGQTMSQDLLSNKIGMGIIFPTSSRHVPFISYVLNASANNTPNFEPINLQICPPFEANQGHSYHIEEVNRDDAHDYETNSSADFSFSQNQNPGEAPPDLQLTTEHTEPTITRSQPSNRIATNDVNP
ncbi:hypothetical protein S245_045177, partial [Arachis hypogaea]